MIADLLIPSPPPPPTIVALLTPDTTTSNPQKPTIHNLASTFNTKLTNLDLDPWQTQTHQHSTFNTVQSTIITQ